MAGPRPGRTHEELGELAAIEALGALDPADRAALAAHLRGGCAACAEALHESRRAAELIAGSAPPIAPGHGVRARVLEDGAREAGRRTRPPGPRRLRRLVPLASAAALALVAAAAALQWQAAERRAREVAGLLATIEAPATRVVALAATEPGGRASARAFVAADGTIALLVQGLPPPPPGRVYQLWCIEGGVPASAGVFGTSAAGGARHTLASVAPHGEGFVLAVTLEPAGGVPAPTGPMVLAQR
jgi:anti-sigma-K factor RskA